MDDKISEALDRLNEKLADAMESIVSGLREAGTVSSTGRAADPIHYGPVWNKPRASGESFAACDAALDKAAKAAAAQE